MQEPAPGDVSTVLPSFPSQASLADDSHCVQRVIAEDPEWSLVVVPQLTELCLQHIIHNFEKNPIIDRLLPEHQRKVLDKLSTGLPLSVTANLIHDEDYWKRCCTQRWKVCDISNYGNSWKRMFFERHLENILKCFIPNVTDPNQVLELIPLCKEYVWKLEIDQFLPPLKLDQKEEEEEEDFDDSGSDLELSEVSMHHYDLGVLITALPHLEELDLTYGVKDCGMNFEWNLFNFTYQDCSNLAVALKKCHNLKIFKLTCSQVDDDKARLLIQNLLDHPSLMELNLSHNLIGDKGARAAGKLINHSKLEILDLCNNQIRHLGAQALAQALATNSTLTSLNLHLNCVEDEGGQAIGRALLTNTTLKTIHLGSNELSEPTATLFSQVLAQNSTLTSINFSCNHIGLTSSSTEMRKSVQIMLPFTPAGCVLRTGAQDGGKQLLEGLMDNNILTEFDLRLAEVGQESEYLINQILRANQERARLKALQNPSVKPL